MATQPSISPATPSPPNRESKITLREVTKDNWRVVIELNTLEEQKGNVSPNVKSLCESHYSDDAWVRAIYADETPVGFLMMSIWDPEEWYAIWRFMIDKQYQSLGFGKEAVSLAIKHIKENHPQAKLIRLMSASKDGGKGVTAEFSPYDFYYKLGFREIEPIDEDGCVEMGLNL